jgi:hypothetical protein
MKESSKARKGNERIGRRLLMLAVAVSLVSLQQAWAVAACLCGSPAESHHLSCAQHCAQMFEQSTAAPGHCQMSSRQEAAKESSPPSRPGTNPYAAPVRSDSPEPASITCCEPRPRAAMLAASFEPQRETATDDESPDLRLPPVRERFPHATKLRPPRSCPIYLSVSSLLI